MRCARQWRSQSQLPNNYSYLAITIYQINYLFSIFLQMAIMAVKLLHNTIELFHLDLIVKTHHLTKDKHDSFLALIPELFGNID